MEMKEIKRNLPSSADGTVDKAVGASGARGSAGRSAFCLSRIRRVISSPGSEDCHIIIF